MNKNKIDVEEIKNVLTGYLNDVDRNLNKLYKLAVKLNCEKNLRTYIENVKSIAPTDSQFVLGLQYVDNLCSTVWMNKTGTDDYGFYELIKNDTIDVVDISSN